MIWELLALLLLSFHWSKLSYEGGCEMLSVDRQTCLARIHGILLLKGRKRKVHWGTVRSLCHSISKKVLESSLYS